MRANNPQIFKIPKVEIVLGRIDWILERCKGKKVLHLGCVDEGLTKERFESGALMHTRLVKVCKEVWGLDISSDGLGFLKAMGLENLIQGDVERIGEIEDLKGQHFDIVLVSEIIEHLNNPGSFLQSVKDLFSTDTEMIITVPNCFRLTGLVDKLKGYELVHPDHNYWFSYRTLLTLLSKNGYAVSEILAYSYSDYRIMPSLKRVVDRIRPRNQRRLLIEAKGSNIEISHSKGNPIVRVVSMIKSAVTILFRRVLYKRNPFLADGIIALVRPEK